MLYITKEDKCNFVVRTKFFKPQNKNHFLILGLHFPSTLLKLFLSSVLFCSSASSFMPSFQVLVQMQLNIQQANSFTNEHKSLRLDSPGYLLNYIGTRVHLGLRFLMTGLSFLDVSSRGFITSHHHTQNSEPVNSKT